MTKEEKDVIEAAKFWLTIRSRVLRAIEDDVKFSFKDPFFDSGEGEDRLNQAVRKLPDFDLEEAVKIK